ncbi:MAG TPA: radical SAM family heme chaperone HemW, partial [Candidatus Eisenbacteria bacterium]
VPANRMSATREAAIIGTMESQAQPPLTACYLHTPFCAVKCSYCNFFSGVRQAGQMESWFEGLVAEIAHHDRLGRLTGRSIDTLYVGGGTPTAFDPPELARLFALLRSSLSLHPDAEITSEANPESLTDSMAETLVGLGVSRVSMGAQSFHDDELLRLNRPHDAAAIVQAVRAARRAGIGSLNLDLIYGLPGQTLDRWQYSVQAALELAPDHLSCYCLILEPATPLTVEVGAGRQPRPDDGLQRDMFDWTVETLVRHGYEFYELSNFARPGRRSQHNLRYWLGQPWLGLGPSAHSYLDGARGANPANLDLYRRRFTAAEPQDTFRPVAPNDLVFERVFMNLRLIEGMNLNDFQSEFGAPLDYFYPEVLPRLLSRGQLVREGQTLRLGPEWWFLSDGIFTEFAP